VRAREKASMTGASAWLEELGLGQYAQVFAEQSIDFSVISDLTEGDLEKLGIPLSHRKRMLKAIGALAGANRAADTDQASVAPPRLSPERRQLTLLFCDLVGSAALASELDPEDLSDVIHKLQDTCAAVIKQAGGYVAKYSGDGVFAYFGYPEAQEDEAEQAVRAGLALIETVLKIKTSVDAALEVRVGIATGTVIVADLLMGQGTGVQDVVGDTPNLAARLQTLAEPGTVLICANTRRLTEGYFECRDLGSLAIKGWAEPVQARQVLGPSGVESRFKARHRAKLPPLIGREEEIALLSSRWRDAIQGEGRVVVLAGEPGIGKSHIALAFEEQVASEPHIPLRYFCSAQHCNSALFPFIGQLERAARFERSDSPAKKLAKLKDLLAQSSSNTDDVAVLASLWLATVSVVRGELPRASNPSRVYQVPPKRAAIGRH
jgi:class 3 adenylate cyclase